LFVIDIIPLYFSAALLAALASAAAAAATLRCRNSEGSEVVATISIDYMNETIQLEAEEQ
jgi:hypothetical protein